MKKLFNTLTKAVLVVALILLAITTSCVSRPLYNVVKAQNDSLREVNTMLAIERNMYLQSSQKWCGQYIHLVDSVKKNALWFGSETIEH